MSFSKRRAERVQFCLEISNTLGTNKLLVTSIYETYTIRLKSNGTLFANGTERNMVKEREARDSGKL